MTPREAARARSWAAWASRRTVLGGAALLAAVALAAAAHRVMAARARDAARARAVSALSPEPPLTVPRVRGAISLDGDMDDEGWRGPVARTGAFVGSDGGEAHPYSDARFAWGDGHLYLALYAADEDVRATHAEPDSPLWLDDSFHVWIDDGEEELAIDLSPLGAVTDGKRARAGDPAAGRPFDYAWSSGAHVSKEVDGTLNDARDDDEEWVLEVAIPLASLGLRGTKGERVALAVKRCDTTKAGQRACGTWGDPAHPHVLVLDE